MVMPASDSSVTCKSHFLIHVNHSSIVCLYFELVVMFCYIPVTFLILQLHSAPGSDPLKYLLLHLIYILPCRF